MSACLLDDEHIASLVEVYESGLSIRETTANLGVPKTTVQNTLAGTEVVMRPAVRAAWDIRVILTGVTSFRPTV